MEKDRISGAFYWIIVSGRKTVGFYESPGKYPWQIVGSDSIFGESEIDSVGPAIEDLTEAERRTCVTAKIGSSFCEIDALLSIIERLTGERFG